MKAIVVVYLTLLSISFSLKTCATDVIAEYLYETGPITSSTELKTVVEFTIPFTVGTQEYWAQIFDKDYNPLTLGNYATTALPTTFPSKLTFTATLPPSDNYYIQLAISYPS